MRKIYYDGSSESNVEITSENIPQLYGDMIGNFPSYWMDGSHDAIISIYEDGVKTESFRISAYEGLGLHLVHTKWLYLGKDARPSRYSIVHLSVYDKTKLDQVVDICVEQYASVGLFLPPELAWKGIKEFIETGRMSIDINWITPDMLPDEGNWC